MITVALATYNGQTYLPEFLQSLQRQTVTDWTLLVGDDSSTDETPPILRAWAARDTRIVLLEPADSSRHTPRAVRRSSAESSRHTPCAVRRSPFPPARLGAAANFGRLMQQACERNAQCVFFADQDDVWLPDKIERQLRLLHRTQASVGAGTPVLVHSDSIVADESLNTIHSSLMRYAALHHAKSHSLNGLLLHNCVTGCTAVVNRRLLELATPLPSNVVMHDWWLALCAAAAGRIALLAEPTVLYRQHSGNAIGARDSTYMKAFRKVIGGRGQWNRDMQTFHQTIAQAEALRGRLDERDVACTPDVIRLLEQYCRLFEEPNSALNRIITLRRLGVPAAHPLRQALSYLRITMMDQQVLRKAA